MILVCPPADDFLIVCYEGFQLVILGAPFLYFSCYASEHFGSSLYPASSLLQVAGMYDRNLAVKVAVAGSHHTLIVTEEGLFMRPTMLLGSL